MKYLQNITSNKKFNNYRPLVAYDAEEDKLYYFPFENLPPFTIIAVSNITVSMSHNVIQYSYDGLQWQDLPVGDTFSASAGDKVYVQCSSPSVSSSYGMGTFSIEGTFRIAGNIMSLVNGDNYNTDYSHKAYQFKELLRSNTGLLDASDLILPATTLQSSCYNQMFSGCTSLANAPILPATELTPYCYEYMFKGCATLVNAPELPATTLAKYCYRGMFYSCTNLVNAPELPATVLAMDCYEQMFETCTSLVNAPELPATTLADYCYSAMFSGCTSLVNAPELPATALKQDCYNSMFFQCTSLVNAPELPATTLANSCYNYMFYSCTSLSYIKAMFLTEPYLYTDDWVNGVASTGTFVKNVEATWETAGVIPEGWTVETAAA